jgi:hypothetical protein
MKFRLLCMCLTFVVSSRLLAEDYKPELFQILMPVYEDDFSQGTLDTNFWQPRQGTTWVVKDGVLVGSPSPKEFQDQKIAEGDKAHAGFKPVIFLEKVPENFVVRFRVRFDAEGYQARFPLIDLGHHVNTLIFAENSTTLVLKKNQKTIKEEEVLLPLNTWVNVTLELKKGVLLVKLNEKKFIIDYGRISIDNVKVYEGLN